MKCKKCGRERGIFLANPPKSPFCDFCLNRKYGITMVDIKSHRAKDVKIGDMVLIYKKLTFGPIGKYAGQRGFIQKIDEIWYTIGFPDGSVLETTRSRFRVI